MKDLIVRDGHATLSGDTTTFTCPSGCLEIVAPDGRTLFDITVHADGTLEVSANSCVKIGDKILDSSLLIQPRAGNNVYIKRSEYDR